MEDQIKGIQTVKIEPYDPKKEYFEHADADPTSGMFLTSDVALSSFMSIFMKKFGKHILSGGFNITTIIPPSQALYKGNYLELNSWSNTILPKYLKAATRTEDKQERLKLISVGIMANNYLSDQKACGKIP